MYFTERKREVLNINFQVEFGGEPNGVGVLAVRLLFLFVVLGILDYTTQDRLLLLRLSKVIPVLR